MLPFPENKKKKETGIKYGTETTEEEKTRKNYFIFYEEINNHRLIFVQNHFHTMTAF